jgi:hypothetical protein
MLAGNYLDGTIPAELGELSNLRVLNLGKNGFTDVGLGELALQLYAGAVAACLVGCLWHLQTCPYWLAVRLQCPAV